MRSVLLRKKIFRPGHVELLFWVYVKREIFHGENSGNKTNSPQKRPPYPSWQPPKKIPTKRKTNKQTNRYLYMGRGNKPRVTIQRKKFSLWGFPTHILRCWERKLFEWVQSINWLPLKLQINACIIEPWNKQTRKKKIELLTCFYIFNFFDLTLFKREVSKHMFLTFG